MEFSELTHIAQFKQARDDLIEMLAIFPSEKIEEELFDGLTIKQLMLNITLSEMYLIAVLEDFVDGRDITWEDPYDADDPLMHPDSAWEDLFDDLNFAGEKLITTLETYPAELWDKKLWNDKNITPRKLVEIDLGYYKDIYLEEIVKHIPFEYH